MEEEPVSATPSFIAAPRQQLRLPSIQSAISTALTESTATALQGSTMMQGMTAITPTARGRAQQRAIEWDPYGGMTAVEVSYEGMTQKAREGVAGSGEAGYLQFQARESREAVHDVWGPARETYALVNARDAVVPTGEETNLSQPVSAPDDSDRSGAFVTLVVQPDGLQADALKQAAQEGKQGEGLGRVDHRSVRGS